MALNPVEFIRRFLLHVLPSGFVRIRHYGFLANRMRQDKLALCRALLGVKSMPEPTASEASGEPEKPREPQTGTSACPCCGVGRMVIIDVLRATPINRRKLGPLVEAAEFDTSRCFSASGSGNVPSYRPDRPWRSPWIPCLLSKIWCFNAGRRCVARAAEPLPACPIDSS